MGTHSNTLLESLQQVCQQHGPAILADRNQLEGLLRDHCSGQPRDINLLAAAIRHGIIEELVALPSPQLEVSICNQLSRRLENSGIATDGAQWAVMTWAVALNKATSAQIPGPLSSVPETPFQVAPPDSRQQGSSYPIPYIVDWVSDSSPRSPLLDPSQPHSSSVASTTQSHQRRSAPAPPTQATLPHKPPTVSATPPRPVAGARRTNNQSRTRENLWWAVFLLIVVGTVYYSQRMIYSTQRVKAPSRRSSPGVTLETLMQHARLDADRETKKAKQLIEEIDTETLRLKRLDDQHLLTREMATNEKRKLAAKSVMALKHSERALQVDSANETAWVQKAAAMFFLKRQPAYSSHAKSLAVVKAALKRYPQNVDLQDLKQKLERQQPRS